MSCPWFSARLCAWMGTSQVLSRSPCAATEPSKCGQFELGCAISI